MHIVAIFQKIDRLKSLLSDRGVIRAGKYLYQRIRSNLKARKDYQKWIEQNRFTNADLAVAKAEIETWQIRPKFSIIMPVYNVEAQWLEKAIESVRAQIYPDWELCIADDASSKSHVRSILTQYSELDSRIKVKVRTENGGISATSNSALELVTGDYIVLLDHDDELTIDALFENAKLINSHPEADYIYSDEDKIDAGGNRFDPVFKPDWSPDYFYSTMYTCHLAVVRSSLVREIGGFRSKYDGSQDYDLILRIVEKTCQIYHIAKILYHWRTIKSSTASGSSAKPWAFEAGKRALESMLQRSQYPGCVEETINPGIYRVRRSIVEHPLVSIIIYSAGDDDSLLPNCISKIESLSTYRNFEIIIAKRDALPQSSIANTSAKDLSGDRTTRTAESFNFSTLVNQSTVEPKGEFLLFLRASTEVVTPDWLESMLELAQQKEIGAVGAKLLSPAGYIYHTGIIMLEGNPSYAFYGFDGNHSGYHCSNIVNRNYLAVTGACLMVRSQLFQQLARIDASFLLDYSDIDLCLSAHQAGYRNVVTPYAQLIYYESRGKKNSLEIDNLDLLQIEWKKYFHNLKSDPYYNPNLSQQIANFEIF
jgi:O-antigen biosynthesis protein